MLARRILSLWFPRLGAERHLRRLGGPLPQPFAVTQDQVGAQVVTSLNAEAEGAGVRLGQPLRDAQAMCPGLITRMANPLADAAFLAVLRRWAGKYSPRVAEEPPDSLMIDLTGCSHLFGGEAALMAQVKGECADLGLTLRAGIADTPGAAWALARFASQGASPARSGDDIAQEARATRSRAARRRSLPPAPLAQATIAPPGQLRQVLAPLPSAALRLGPETVEGLARLGLHRVGDLMGLPRGALSRRFGTDTLRRLDQALGLETEPISPARAPLHFAVRLSFPDPIGLRADVEVALDRLLPVLSARLGEKGRGARRVRLQAFRCDGPVEVIEVGLASPTAEPARIRPLLLLKLDRIDAGFGIDCLRLSAPQTEPVYPSRTGGVEDAGPRPTAAVALADLLGTLGARLGTDAVTRLHPADSHIPEKSFQVLTAAFSAPAAGAWPAPPGPRPLLLFRPEPVTAPDMPQVPATFRWRRRALTVTEAIGPERIAPEWWLDDPEWRSGLRDYWRVTTDAGDRLWLFYAHGADLSPGWFCHGQFC
jgi:protein ImuB